MTISLCFSKELTARLIISNIEPRLKNKMYHWGFIGIEYNKNVITLHIISIMSKIIIHIANINHVLCNFKYDGRTS